MKKIKLATSLITALLIASPIVSAEGYYPASNFKPIIVYQDKSAISKPKVVAKATPAPVKKQESSNTTELGLLLAVVGAVLFLAKGRSGSSPKATGGATGVDRYLAAQAGGASASSSRAKTGVDRYLNG